MSILVSLGIWRSLRCLSLVVSLCSDGYQAPVLELQLYVGIIFQCRETYFTCSFSHTNISQRQQYAHQSHHCHVLINCWTATLTSSPIHSLTGFPSFLTQTSTTTTIPPLPPSAKPKARHNTTSPNRQPAYQERNPTELTPQKWPQRTSPTTTASCSPPPGTASRPSLR
jgi:hypothetical protein